MNITCRYCQYGRSGRRDPCYRRPMVAVTTVLLILLCWFDVSVQRQRLVSYSLIDNKTLTNTTTSQTATKSYQIRSDSNVKDTPTMTRWNPIDDSIAWNATTYFYDAKDGNGTLGYIADPTSLQRVLHKDEDFFATLTRHFRTTDEPNISFLSMTNTTTTENAMSWSPPRTWICQDPPGQGLEGPYGYQLLRDKIRWIDQNRNDKHDTHPTSSHRPPRLLCAIYTHPPKHSLAQMAALTYGRHCDGFLAFTSTNRTSTMEHYGFVNFQHPGDESYHNMWQKVRSIWGYIGQHYVHDYEYFHLGGDDMYVLVNNLKHLLQQLENEPSTQPNTTAYSQPKPIFVGQWRRQKTTPFLCGGPGYTMNRAALQQLTHNTSSHNNSLSTCFPHKVASYEDRLLSLCMKRIGIVPSDSRDRLTGQQLYHDVDPNQVFVSRPNNSQRKSRRPSFHQQGQVYWASLPHPNNTTSSRPVGDMYGLDAAGTHSVSFHHIQSPKYMARLYALIHGLCDF